jgi:ribonuclease-3
VAEGHPLRPPLRGRSLSASPKGARARPDTAIDRAALEQRLHYRFTRAELLVQALVHASAAERGDRGNERLEFLGDRVLGLVIAETLLTRFPAEREGSIARRHASLVSQPVLARVADAIGLGNFLTFAKGDREAGAAKNPAILADALEAVIAAIYLDGGLEQARGVVLAHWQALLVDDSAPPSDPKTALQEWALARGLALPTYRVVKAEGPPHSPRFEITVELEGVAPAAGEGRSKRAAEKSAASALLAVVQTAAPTLGSAKRARRRG